MKETKIGILGQCEAIERPSLDTSEKSKSVSSNRNNKIVLLSCGFGAEATDFSPDNRTLRACITIGCGGG